MEVYETNYRLLARLIPNLRSLGDHEVSSVAECLDLHLRMVERHKYTTLISLTYLFDREGATERVAEPGVLIRLYHDARVAEVYGCGACVEEAVEAEGARHGLPDLAERQWSVNLFLEKWLAYCLERGHRFSTCPPAAEAGRVPEPVNG
ncbi:DUF1249 domain-containing protein [Endothiovibrio diazotrophicus]